MHPLEEYSLRWAGPATRCSWRWIARAAGPITATFAACTSRATFQRMRAMSPSPWRVRRALDEGSCITSAPGDTGSRHVFWTQVREERREDAKKSFVLALRTLRLLRGLASDFRFQGAASFRRPVRGSVITACQLAARCCSLPSCAVGDAGVTEPPPGPVAQHPHLPGRAALAAPPPDAAPRPTGTRLVRMLPLFRGGRTLPPAMA